MRAVTGPSPCTTSSSRHPLQRHGCCFLAFRPSARPPRCLLRPLRAVNKTDTKPSTKLTATPTAIPPPNNRNDLQPPEQEPPGWGILNASAWNRKFDVPWGPVTTVAGMGAWGLSFTVVGFYLVPKLYLLSGVDLRAASATDKATFTLAVQLLQTAAGIGVIRTITDKYRFPPPIDRLKDPELLASSTASTSLRGQDELFNYNPLSPFTKPNGWLFWGVVGMVAAPFVVGTLAYALTSVGYDKAYSETRGTVDAIAPIISADSTSFLSLLAVTGVLAPLLEETVFRGFLLTSLTRYMPTWGAVLASSACFGAAHMSARDFPVLTGLGVLLGFIYVRSRNLLTPMLIHGAWNSTVLTILFYLASSGVDVQQLLHEMKDL